MRPEFFVPEALIERHPDVAVREAVQDVLSLVGVQVPASAIGRWTRFELIIAYDWAWREHLVASDYPKRMRREKPRFVILAQATSETHLGKRVRATYGEASAEGGREVAEGIMLATQTDGTVVLEKDDGTKAFCWPMLDFEVVPGPVRAGAR